MRRDMDYQPKYRIEIFWSEEDAGYIANIPELKYCSAFGETREEALSEILVAEELHLETLAEMGREAPEPEPSPAPTQEIELSAYNPAPSFSRLLTIASDVFDAGHTEAPDTAPFQLWENAPIGTVRIVADNRAVSSHHVATGTLDEEFFEKLLAQ